ncbi:MAG: hypothetical protein UW69_C0039G0004 [Microgenomates group bacterium GW2011_GWA2_44_7]|nr:MAG: hypothetical protein UW69_C0039G0004 [Microgenomates group bacterium GW2011_GWA2_44_7]
MGKFLPWVVILVAGLITLIHLVAPQPTAAQGLLWVLRPASLAGQNTVEFGGPPLTVPYSSIVRAEAWTIRADPVARVLFYDRATLNSWTEGRVQGRPGRYEIAWTQIVPVQGALRVVVRFDDVQGDLTVSQSWSKVPAPPPAPAPKKKGGASGGLWTLDWPW